MTIAILGTGQSNAGVMRAFDWTCNPRATLWNWPLTAGDGTDGAVGNAFVPIDSALSMALFNLPMASCPHWKFASEIARLNPGENVFLVNIFFGGRQNNYWLSGYDGYPITTPDIWKNIQNNAVPALAACGATKFDYILDYQGEDNAGDPNYFRDLQVKLARFKREPWCAPSTRFILFGIAGSAQWSHVNPPLGPPADLANAVRLEAAQSDPVYRRFVPSTLMPWPDYWSDLPHLSGLGADTVGATAAASAVIPVAPVGSAALQLS